jgi:hypothetical protein
VSRLGHVWREHRLLLAATVIALAVTLFFAVRLAVFALYWSAHRDEAIAGWMTPRYIAHSWGVPPAVIGEALGLEPGDRSGPPPTLEHIAAERGQPLAEVEAAVAAAIARHRAERP